MKHWIFFLLLIFSQKGFSEQPWEVARKNPSTRVLPIKAKALGKASAQISCNHLKFRYKVLENILKDLSWIVDVKSRDKNKLNAHDYITNRLQADPSILANAPAFEIEFKLTDKITQKSLAPIEAIGILGAANFDVEFNPTDEGDIERKITINTYDICFKGYVDVLILKKCPKDEMQFEICDENNVCVGKETYDWQKCEDVRVARVNLNKFIEKLGKRDREIKKGN